MIFSGGLYGGAFVTLKPRGFFTLKSRLSGFKARFSLGGAFFFLTDGVKLGFFLTEILHQRDIAWANPGACPAFNAVSDIVGHGLVVLLPFAEPVKLLRQKVGRTGIGAGAAADTALLFLRLAHFTGGGRKKAVGDLHHRNIEPGEGEAHQRTAHNYHLLGGRTKARVSQQMAHGRT